MKKILLITLVLPIFATFSFPALIYAETTRLEIEGLVSPVSPEILTTSLEEKIKVKVVELVVINTPSGWPILTLEHDPAVVSKAQIEATIATIEDPAGHTYSVHKGPLQPVVPLLMEEEEASAILGPDALDIPEMKSPISPSKESVSRGKVIYVKNCAKCHGLSGDGNGPAALSFTTPPKPLINWKDANAASDGYLFWFITNGRTDMPPWGLVLSENERWDVINYIKNLGKAN